MRHPAPRSPDAEASDCYWHLHLAAGSDDDRVMAVDHQDGASVHVGDEGRAVRVNLNQYDPDGLAAEVAGEPPPDYPDFPGIDDGVAGMAFIEAAVASARQGAAWVPVAS